MAYTLFIDQRAATFKYLLHRLPCVVQIVFNNGPGATKYPCNFLYLKRVDIGKHQREVLFQWQRFHYTGKTKIDMFPYLVPAVFRCAVDSF